MWVLVAADPGVTAEEVMSSLPSPDEVTVQAMLLGFSKTSIVGAMGCFPTAPLLLALVCEKFGRWAEAVSWAEAAASEDCSKMGTKSVVLSPAAHRVHGRCLAKFGKTTDASGPSNTPAKPASGVSRCYPGCAVVCATILYATSKKENNNIVTTCFDCSPTKQRCQEMVALVRVARKCGSSCCLSGCCSNCHERRRGATRRSSTARSEEHRPRQHRRRRRQLCRSPCAQRPLNGAGC
eukprot:SAG22_NODE_784_length_7228_cov_10.581620_3_plen_237_part_00